MSRSTAVLLVLLLSMTATAQNGVAIARAPSYRSAVSFASLPIGVPPAGFSVAYTGRDLGPGWEVRAGPNGYGGHVAGPIITDAKVSGFPLCLYDGGVFDDVMVSTRFYATVGETDRAAGLVLRVQDQDNYYCVRANCLEDNIRFYRVVAGKRIQIAGVDHVPHHEDRWHSLRLEARGERFRVWLNEVFLFEARDATFPRAGRVGLWTKADSTTWFDGLVIAPPSAATCRDFETADLGAEPAELSSAAGGETAPGRWSVLSDPSSPAGERVVALIKSGDGKGRGGYFLVDPARSAQDVRVSVRFRTYPSEMETRLAGLVARRVDNDDYTFVRVNPRERNVRVYRIAAGKRTQLAETHHLPMDEGAWHQATLVADGPRLTVLVDGVIVVTAADDRPLRSGAAGIWTMPGSGVTFDALELEPAAPVAASSGATTGEK